MTGGSGSKKGQKAKGAAGTGFQALKDLVTRFKPTLIFLMEVEVDVMRVKMMKTQLKFEGMLFVKGLITGEAWPFFGERKTR